jgi:hypothetical protein
MTMPNSPPELQVDLPDKVVHADAESRWQGTSPETGQQSEIVVDRWTDTRVHARREALAAPDGRFMLGIALAPTRGRLLSGPEMIFDGVMTSGMSYVCSLPNPVRGICRTSRLFASLRCGGLIQKQPARHDSERVASDAAFATITPRDALINLLARAVQTTEDVAARTTSRPCFFISQQHNRSTHYSQKPRRHLKLVRDASA